MGYSKGYEYECKNCGKEVELSYFRSDEPKFCSNSCQHEYQDELHSVECSFCGSGLEVDDYTFNRNDHFFCDRECFNEHQKTRVQVECEVCGKEEWVTPTRAEYYRTCSKECVSALRRNEWVGAGNPAFRADVSSEDIRKLYERGKSLPQIARMVGISIQGASDRLEKIGIERREAGYPRRVETSFGLRVRSRYEKRVAEILREMDVSFEYEPSIPGPYVPDFALHDGTLLEVWGVENSDEYEKRRRVKTEWYEAHGYEVIDVEPKEMKSTIKEELNI